MNQHAYHHGVLRNALIEAVGEIISERGVGAVSLRPAWLDQPPTTTTLQAWLLASILRWAAGICSKSATSAVIDPSRPA